jgi:hypothetical protein
LRDVKRNNRRGQRPSHARPVSRSSDR